MKTIIPRITTRGYYDLYTGKKIKRNSYNFFPKSSLKKLFGKKELTIMIHGLRNNKSDAVNKFEIAKKRLKQLGYTYPVIGFSYDSNTTGAHLQKTELHALHVGQKIAQQNGKNLSEFIIDFKKKSPHTKIRLMGHSLGTQVILSSIEFLGKQKSTNGIIESVYFFGASIPSSIPNSNKYKKLFEKIISNKTINYFSPSDGVLKYAHDNKLATNTLGLFGAKKTSKKFLQRKVNPTNHRFISYAQTIRKFP